MAEADKKWYNSIMKQMILSLVAGVCATFCSLAETNVVATVDMTRKRPYVELSAKRVVGDKNNTLDIDSRMSAIPGKDATYSGEVFFSFGIELRVLPRVLTNGSIPRA